jgi:hypothetical protein
MPRSKSGKLSFRSVDKIARLMKPTTTTKRKAPKPPVFKLYQLTAPNSKPLTELGLEVAITIAIKHAGGANR